MVESILRILKQLHPEHTDAELAEIKKQIKSTLPQLTRILIWPGTQYYYRQYRQPSGPDGSELPDRRGLRQLAGSRRDGGARAAPGNCDLALAGGVNSNTSPVLMMIFSQLGALSHRGQLSSFDKDADGTLLGEGVGMVVLKRLAEAERDGNHIYAVLKNIGIASDGALHTCSRRAWKAKNWLCAAPTNPWGSIL